MVTKVTVPELVPVALRRAINESDIVTDLNMAFWYRDHVRQYSALSEYIIVL